MNELNWLSRQGHVIVIPPLSFLQIRQFHSLLLIFISCRVVYLFNFLELHCFNKSLN